MTNQTPEQFIQEITKAAQEHYVEYTHAMWQAAISGSEKDNEREKEAQRQQMRFWANPERFEMALAFDEAGHSDPISARALRLIRLSAAKAQQDEASIQRITNLEAGIRTTYYTYRAEVNGDRLSDNELDEILTDSTDSDQVRQAWLASKEVGAIVADELRQLAHARNQAAQKQGYRDHFARSLELNEIDENDLFELFDELEHQTNQPFQNLMGEIKTRRAERFGISVDQLGPWHFGDRYFQRAPALGEEDFTEYFRGHDPVPLALATYDAWGMEVRDILERSDLYAREGKNQHAFCLDLDQSGDVRTLNNLEPTHRWISTLFHELGHAVYDKYIDNDLPWLLRKPPHTLSTEAIAILAPRIIAQPAWLVENLNLSTEQAEFAAKSARDRRRAEGLIFTRWVLVMTNFERELYKDPEADLDSLWWDLKEKYQGLKPPHGRSAPDWAAKYHIALAPVYYQNYELGNLVSAQLEAAMNQEIGGFGLSSSVGDFFKQKVFASGASLPWDQHVQAATGQPLNPAFFTNTIKN